MRKYPIGLQNFREIREGDYLYIDKTKIIHQLIDSGKYYFLSRPRRFGKSLLMSTINEIFSGSKELFSGLWIENNWNWERKHPVIKMSFSNIGVKTIGFKEAVLLALEDNANRLNITLEATTIDLRFKELIQKAGKKEKVVILIDEYDKPIIDNLEDLPLAEKNRSLIKDLYSILKDADPYIRFLMLTGVSKFSKVSIFSDLNNLEDITLSDTMHDLLGITQTEIEENLKEEIKELADKYKDIPDILQEIRKWYNGYSWNGTNTVYNPFSLLNFFKSKQFHNFWFETGTPTFLIKQLQKRKVYDFENAKVSANDLGNFNIENLLPVTLLFQTGYLTIKDYSYITRLYTLGYPNMEVKASLTEYLLAAYNHTTPSESISLASVIFLALKDNDVDRVITAINTLMASIPYDLWKGATEFYYHTIVHLAFTLVGTYIQSEVHSAEGRCDAIAKTDTHIYVLEFKLDRSADEALQQIKDKNYLAPYATDKRIKVAIGINFSSESRKVESYLVRLSE